MDARSLPVLRLVRGAERTLVCGGPWITWAEHWVTERNQLCAEGNCPACEYYAPKRRVACVARPVQTSGELGPRVLLNLPADATYPADPTGYYVLVKRLAHRMSVKWGQRVDVVPDDLSAWLTLRELFQLPPWRSEAELASGQWWSRVLRVAEGRLRVSFFSPSRSVEER